MTELERFQLAAQILRDEYDRLFSNFGAFLVANALLMGFLLNATRRGGFPGDPGTAMAGGAIGIMITVLWWSAYERNTKAVDMRLALVREAEPAGLEIFTGRPRSFAKGGKVEIDDDPYEFRGLGRIRIRVSVRLLILVFLAGYAVIAGWATIDALA